MNADIRFANSLTHLKIVVTALIASIVFIWIGIAGLRGTSWAQSQSISSVSVTILTQTEFVRRL